MPSHRLLGQDRREGPTEEIRTKCSLNCQMVMAVRYLQQCISVSRAHVSRGRWSVIPHGAIFVILPEPKAMLRNFFFFF